MSSNKELQEEEIEVLRSIYDGDERYKELSPTSFQYKVGEESNPRSVLLEVSWGENYPDELPCINLDTFYNKHLATSFKTFLCQTLTEQATPLLGMAMTYTLFEYVKENIDDIFTNQPPSEAPSQVCPTREDKADQQGTEPDALSGASLKNKDKKEQLTKAQKRKIINRQDVNGEMPRGWNWVDVVKHLCQTGRGAESEPAT